MPQSKARFQQPPKSGSGSKPKGSASGIAAVPSSTPGIGSGSKRGGPTASAPAGKPSSHVQVIYNGKIVTPQSLIPHRPKTSSQPQKKVIQVASIPENGSEAADKPGALKSLNKKLDGSAERMMHSRMSTMNNSLLAFDGKKTQTEEMSVVELTETQTEFILNLTSFVVASDLREVSLTTDRNARYEALVEEHKNAADSFACKPTQTLNNSQKNQMETAAPDASRDCGSQANCFDITDATGSLNKTSMEAEHSGLGSIVGTAAEGQAAGVGASVGAKKNFGLTVQQFVNDTVNVSLATPGCLLDLEYINRPLPDKKEGKKKGIIPAAVAAPPTNASVSGMNVGGGGGSGSNVNVASAFPVKGGGGGGGGATARDGGGGGKDNSNTSKVSGSALAPGGSDPNSGSESHDQTSESHAGTHQHTGSNAVQEQDSLQILREKQAAEIMASPMLLKRLQMLERAVQQNAYHRPQLDYRDLPDVPPLNLVSADRVAVVESTDQLFSLGGGLGRLGLGGAAAEKQKLEEENAAENGAAGEKADEPDRKIKKLFSFYYADLVQGRQVTCMAWNSVNCDLLAVGYGKMDTFLDTSKVGEAVDEELQGGLVLFWSLRNPEYPEKILRTPHAVSALDFSILSPMTLALGQVNGDICIYDVRRDDWATPIESSAGMAGAHCDPVWQLKWVVRGVERIETLVSISTDGAMLEWNLKKGLAVSVLMHLKRGGMGEGWISRQAAGFCFDFLPDDLSMYVVGTEEGSLHRCSVSYNEQYLETYQTHHAPVYRVRFSKNVPKLFLTCSADWTIGLYNVQCRTPLALLRSSGEDFSINDIVWCPGNSTVFAAITSDAKLQLWDLAVSSLDPVESYDTSVDDITITDNEGKAGVPSGDLGNSKEDYRMNTAASSKPGTTASMRYESRFDRREEDKDPPVLKLLKNLSQPQVGKRILTTILFGAKSPTVVVGDNRGAVSVYRIFDPLTITHDGPLQQAMKLTKAVSPLCDPTAGHPPI